MNNFKVIACDTDSIFFKKEDKSKFTPNEQLKLVNELNSLMPKNIKWELNGFFPKIITVKAKNYIMELEDGQIKYKGSALKATTKEVALKQFIKEIVESIFNEKQNYVEIYNTYVQEILNVKDISRWASKKTLTSKVLTGTRLNETKVKDTIIDTEYAEGDKIHVYFKEDDTLSLVENFDGNYSKSRLLKKLYETSKVFATIIDKSIFKNYSLKKNYKELIENGIEI